jgi:hypothetical protein
MKLKWTLPVLLVTLTAAEQRRRCATEKTP